jgi:MFS family permease
MAHRWELLGMWAWMPAFLTVALAGSDLFPHAMQGFWIAAAIHFSGGIAAFSMGHASDQFGRKRVLVGMSLIGAICSASIGWMIGRPSIANPAVHIKWAGLDAKTSNGQNLQDAQE